MRSRGEREARESRLASGWIVEGAPDAVAEDEPHLHTEPANQTTHEVPAESDEPDTAVPSQRQQMSTWMLILLGVIGGLYLIYTWVWFSWANYYSSVNAVIAEGSGVLGSVMQQIVFWAAPFAPILWFVTVIAVVRVSRPRALAIWLLVGAVVLVPLPMFSGGGA